jgi:hypothetical protein
MNCHVAEGCTSFGEIVMKKFGWPKRVVLVSGVLGVGQSPVFAGDLGGSNAYSREEYETEIHTGVMEASKAYTRKDYVTALKLYRPLAEQGNAAAQHNRGMRSNISERMSRSQIDEGQAITKQLVRPGEFLKALDAAATRSPSPVH